MMLGSVVRQSLKAGGRLNVKGANVKNLGPKIKVNSPKNPVTNGMNEPIVRVSQSARREYGPGLTPKMHGPSMPPRHHGPMPAPKEHGPGLSPKNYGPAVTGGVPAKLPTPNSPSYLSNPQQAGGAIYGPTQANSPAMGPAFAKGTHKDERWRGLDDIKMTATGQAPASTFFRNREARNKMMNSGEGRDHKWAKGSLSWGRMAGTAAGVYAGIDTLDRMGSGGSLMRNETGRFDMMGVPIL